MIEIIQHWWHSKASEKFAEVKFEYPGMGKVEWSVPIVYPRAGLELEDEAEIQRHIEEIFAAAHPDNHDGWRAEQDRFWKGSKAPVTKPIFDILAKDFSWHSYAEMSDSSNPARRIQDLKEMGYMIATRRRKGRSYEFMLLPVPRGAASGYEWWSGALRKRIVMVLRRYDAYEGKAGNAKALLPDHKFPEVRWDADTRRDSLEDLSDDEIRHDFQLITNQRNQQKREVCRRCYQTGERGFPFGIKFFYEGHAHWPEDVPKTGKVAEAGCRGCGWYDLQAWRDAVSNSLDE